MALPFVYDRVKETSTTTGTGTLTLAGAVSSYQSFSVVGDGNTCHYCIAHQSANEWEVGLGTYTASGTTLARTSVLASSNSGSAVNLSAGTKDVFLVSPGIQQQSLTRIFPVTAPPTSGWSWVNQGTATIATSQDALVLTAPATANHQLRSYVRTAPSTPYTVTVGFLCTMPGNSVTFVGPVWRESGTGELIVMEFGRSLTPTVFMELAKWNSPTSFNSAYLTFTHPMTHGPLTWIQFTDNGTNRITRLSYDGETFVQLHSVGRTDFLTADQIGICVDPGPTYDSVMKLVSWKEE